MSVRSSCGLAVEMHGVGTRQTEEGGDKLTNVLTTPQHRPTTTNISIKIDTTKEVDTDVETNLTFAQPEDLTPVSFVLFLSLDVADSRSQISYKAPESPAFGDRAIAKDDSREGSSDRSMV